jgi:hypothetical protein
VNCTLHLGPNPGGRQDEELIGTPKRGYQGVCPAPPAHPGRLPAHRQVEPRVSTLSLRPSTSALYRCAQARQHFIVAPKHCRQPRVSRLFPVLIAGATRTESITCSVAHTHAEESSVAKRTVCEENGVRRERCAKRTLWLDFPHSRDVSVSHVDSLQMDADKSRGGHY